VPLYRSKLHCWSQFLFFRCSFVPILVNCGGVVPKVVSRSISSPILSESNVCPLRWRHVAVWTMFCDLADCPLSFVTWSEEALPQTRPENKINARRYSVSCGRQFCWKRRKAPRRRGCRRTRRPSRVDHGAVVPRVAGPAAGLRYVVSFLDFAMNFASALVLYPWG
jgi:hypothetical protein